jgi:PAS domain S-box-containing protein
MNIAEELMTDCDRPSQQSDGLPSEPHEHGHGSANDCGKKVRRSRGTKSEWPEDRVLVTISDEMEPTETIDLGRLFLSELTDSGSFDVRGEMLSTTFGKVIQALPIPALLIDRSHKVWVANEAWGRITRDYTQLHGVPFPSLISNPAGRERASQALERVLLERRAQLMEAILQIGRNRVWARMTLRSIRVKKDRFVFLLLEDLTAEKIQLQKNRRLQGELENRVAERTAQLQRANEELRQEISAHKRTLQALEASESQYRAVVEDQTDMIYRFLPDGELTFANAACARFFAKAPNEMTGRNVFEIMHKDGSRKLREMLLALEPKNPTVELDQVLFNSGGERRWTRWTGRGIFDVQGNLTAVQCVGRDITDRKSAAEALRKSEERLRAIFESTQDLIFIKDRDLRITHWNPAVEILLGLDASQIGGLRDEDLFDPRTAAVIHELDERVLRGEVVEVENTLPILGVPMTCLDVRSPLRDADGNVIGVCVMCRDITSRKELGAPKVLQAESFRSAAMQATMERARIAANVDVMVLLQGESGTGKDFLARWIHDHSSRANFSYFSINCAAVPSELAESELFGHDRGAFTGAVAKKRGLLELAEGGTLLLNEIGELSLPLQAKLLSFLDTRSFLRVGGNREIHVNARLMAATHRDLKDEVAAKRFLEPLYHRLNVLKIEIPPLRDRLDDVPVLLERIYADLCSSMRVSEAPVIDAPSIRNLLHYDWPGNVRELRNVLERALILAQGNRIVLRPPADETGSNDITLPRLPEHGGSLTDAVEELTRAMCQEALRRAAGNKAEAARALGISRGALHRILRRFESQGRQL